MQFTWLPVRPRDTCEPARINLRKQPTRSFSDVLPPSGLFEDANQLLVRAKQSRFHVDLPPFRWLLGVIRVGSGLSAFGTFADMNS
jgi:hypothetical protein